MTAIAHSIKSKSLHWKVTIGWGDVVAHKLPPAKHRDGRQTDSGLWLVLDVKNIAGEQFITLARAADIARLPHRSHEILIASAEGLKAAGLSHPILFDCQHTIIVSTHHSGFDADLGKSPIIGHLCGEDRHRLNSIRAKLQAFADMAAAKRSELRKQHCQLRPVK